MSGSIRLACLTCDREDCDGINEIPPGWEEVGEDCLDDDFDWWTLIGTCPECAAEEKRRRERQKDLFS